jgi:hypothetical protein
MYIYLYWNALEAGQFKPVKFIPTIEDADTLYVAVDVPDKYFINAEEVLKAPILGERVKPVLSLEGMKYVLDLVQSVVDARATVLTDEEESDNPFDEFVEE